MTAEVNEVRSYYGQPIIRGPVWATTDIAGYLFLGGLAGGSSILAWTAGDDGPGSGSTATRAKATAAAAAAVSLAALVHDLGRPGRFINMLRVFKPTSPMNVGSWVLAVFAPSTFVAAGSALTGRVPRLGRVATAVAAALGPIVSTYTAVLISDTAVPAWHDGADEMPFVFAGSSAMAAGGMALALATEPCPASARLGATGAAVEIAALEIMRHRLDSSAEAYARGPQQLILRAGRALAVGGAVFGVLGHRRRIWRRVSGAALVGASALTRLGIFRAGQDSADDPRFTVEAQRRRLDQA